jgi:hypothetical protein
MFKSFTATDKKLSDGGKQPAGQRAGRPAGQRAGQRAGRPAGQRAGRPAGEPAGAAEPAVPGTVRRAVWLMYAGAGTMTVFFITALATMSGFKNAVIAANKSAKNPMTPSQINNYVNAYTLYVIVIGLISIGLWLWMARMNARGRNWARVTATILFCLWTINTVGVAGTRVVESAVFPVLAWLIGAVAVFFLWRRDSGEFFGSAGPGRKGS